MLEDEQKIISQEKIKAEESKGNSLFEGRQTRSNALLSTRIRNNSSSPTPRIVNKIHLNMQKSELIHQSRMREKTVWKRNQCHTGPWKVGDSGDRLIEL